MFWHKLANGQIKNEFEKDKLFSNTLPIHCRCQNLSEKSKLSLSSKKVKVEISGDSKSSRRLKLFFYS